MSPPQDITSPGLLAPAQPRRHTEHHVNRPPDIALHGPPAALSPAARLRTHRKTVDTDPGAAVERPPARPASTGIRRTT
ncbi:hypothetical protein [Streptomyces sp. NPDC001604]|uniref:hypothetical protein n=1 Tax=Streptomyces sp. NPDC001604 TaxID=3364593 RepID=UPI00367F1E3D